MQRFVDKEGENLVAQAVAWQCEQGKEMLPDIGHWSAYFSDSYVTLRSATENIWHGTIPKRLIPFLTAVATGKDVEYLSKVILHHKIQVKDLTRLYISTSDKWPYTFGDGFVELKGEMIFTLFAKAIHATKELENILEDAIADDRSCRMHCALTHIESNHAWHAKKFELFGRDKALALIRLQQMPHQIDFSDEANWPHGKASLLFERIGAYSDYVLNQNHRGSSTWWQIMSNRPRAYSKEARIDYYSKIFTAYEEGDNRLLRGIRSIQARSNVDGGQILYQLTCMIKASENIPAIQDVLLNELMLIRAFSDPKNVNFDSMCIGDSVVLDKSSIDPRLIAMLTEDKGRFVDKVCLQLMNIPPEEFNRSDLWAVLVAAKSFNEYKQGLSSVDLDSFLKHIMSAFSIQKQKCPEQDIEPLLTIQVETVKNLAKMHEISKDWIDALTGDDLEVIVMAGFGDKKKLSEQALGRVFSADLGI